MKWLFLKTMLIVFILSGCTAEQLYSTGHAYQRNQCFNIPDQNASNDCLSKTNTKYDDYKREREETNK